MVVIIFDTLCLKNALVFFERLNETEAQEESNKSTNDKKKKRKKDICQSRSWWGMNLRPPTT